MRDDVMTHVTRSASVEVDALEINLNKEDSRSFGTNSMRGVDGTNVATKEGATASFQYQRSSTDDSHYTAATEAANTQAAAATGLRAGLSPRRSPGKHPAQSSNASEILKSSGDSSYVSSSTLFPPIAQSKAVEKTEVRNTADAGGKQCTNEGDGCSRQMMSFTVEENPSLNLHTSKLPINIGVTYSPNKNIVKTVVIEIPDSMPRLTSKPDDYATDGSDMFVDLSPLDSAKQFVRNPADKQERCPMAFTPPSFSLGIDRSQAKPVIDPMPIAFAFPACTVPMMAQPIADGKKAVKFVDPIVQDCVWTELESLTAM
ncbi:hypothetical protein VPH35_110970 [Triticum aestivum]